MQDNSEESHEISLANNKGQIINVLNMRWVSLGEGRGVAHFHREIEASAIERQRERERVRGKGFELIKHRVRIYCRQTLAEDVQDDAPDS